MFVSNNNNNDDSLEENKGSKLKDELSKSREKNKSK